MSWIDRNDRPISCPCGRVLASPKGLYQHLRNNHPNLSDRDRSAMVAVVRKIVAA